MEKDDRINTCEIYVMTPFIPDITSPLLSF